MTTISHRRRRFSYRTIGFGAFFLILFISVLLWRDTFANVFWWVLSPIVQTRAAAGESASGFFAGFASNTALYRENERLRAELASTSILALDRNLLLEENQELKSRLGRVNHTNPASTTVIASIVMHPPDVPYDYFIIDAGAQEKITKGSLVFAGGGVAIGRVLDVYSTTSRVRLFSTPGEKYPAVIRHKGSIEDIPVTIEGQGGSSMIAKVPTGIMVAEGDVVVLTGISLVWVGEVSYVEHREGESFNFVYVHLPINPLMLRYVEVRK